MPGLELPSVEPPIFDYILSLIIIGLSIWKIVEDKLKAIKYVIIPLGVAGNFYINYGDDVCNDFSRTIYKMVDEHIKEVRPNKMSEIIHEWDYLGWKEEWKDMIAAYGYFQSRQ